MSVVNGRTQVRVRRRFEWSATIPHGWQVLSRIPVQTTHRQDLAMNHEFDVDNHHRVTTARGSWRRLYATAADAVALFALLFGTSACGRALPDPVTKANGVATIPIDGLVFVIPEKTWLTGYSRNSTDGQVAGFSLHAAAPKVEPWSPARNEQMYKVPGWGNRIEVRIASNSGQPFVKQTLDWAEKTFTGCKFQQSLLHKTGSVLFCETRWNRLFVVVEDGVLRYRITCDSRKVKSDSKLLVDPSYAIRSFYRGTLRIDTVFSERYLDFGFDMARAIEKHLSEFDKTDSYRTGLPKGELK